MTSFFPVPFRILNIEFPVMIVPGCPRDEVAGPMADGTMTVRMAASWRNRSDDALQAVLAQHYGVPKAAVRIRGDGQPLRRRVRIAATPSAAPERQVLVEDPTPVLAAR
jgi:hypothetical protein